MGLAESPIADTAEAVYLRTRVPTETVVAARQVGRNDAIIAPVCAENLIRIERLTELFTTGV